MMLVLTATEEKMMTPVMIVNDGQNREGTQGPQRKERPKTDAWKGKSLRGADPGINIACRDTV